MPYTAETLRGETAKKRAAGTGPFGANMPEVAAEVETLELVYSSFNDPGDDWCEWRAYDKTGKLIGKRHHAGY